MTNKNNLEYPTQVMIGKISKKDPPSEKPEEEKECHVCKYHPETSTIVVGNLVKILTVNNGNCGMLKPDDIVKVEDIILRGTGIAKLWLRRADCWVKPTDCTWVKVCSGCGKVIKAMELLK